MIVKNFCNFSLKSNYSFQVEFFNDLNKLKKLKTTKQKIEKQQQQKNSNKSVHYTF